jgi:hypothetical protein
VFAGIKNFSEELVFARMQERLVFQGVEDEDFLEDVACIALNRLPARYIRFTVDLMVNLGLEERAQLEQEVAEAVEYGIELVESRRAARDE